MGICISFCLLHSQGCMCLFDGMYSEGMYETVCCIDVYGWYGVRNLCMQCCVVICGVM